MLTPVAQKLCRCEHGSLYSRAEHVFIREHYFTPKSFAAVRKVFSKAYPDEEVQNKTTIHRLATNFRDTGSVCGTVSESSDPIHFLLEENETDCWFQHGGATAHTVNTTTFLH
jgi:hypothetical protein